MLLVGVLYYFLPLFWARCFRKQTTPCLNKRVYSRENFSDSALHTKLRFVNALACLCLELSHTVRVVEFGPLKLIIAAVGDVLFVLLEKAEKLLGLVLVVF